MTQNTLYYGDNLPIFSAIAKMKSATRYQINPADKMQNMFAVPAETVDSDDDDLMDDDE